MPTPNETFDLLSLQASGTLPWNLYLADTVSVGNFNCVPFSTCRPELLALLRGGAPIGKGGFALVFVIDDRTVCKITTCPATQALYAKQLSEDTVVEGLPRVYQYEGAVGIDVGGSLVAKAYVVERCRKPESENERAKIEALLCYLNEESPTFFSAENQDPTHHAKAFSAGALKFPECADPLNWLATFVRKSGFVCGDFKRDNVMLTQRGTLAFVDVLQELIYDPNWEETLAKRQAESSLYEASA